MKRTSYKDIKPPTKEDLERLRKGMDGPIDTSDIPELNEQSIADGTYTPIHLDANGKRDMKRARRERRERREKIEQYKRRKKS